jgi:predicted alpha/beta hydrolase family esterase
MKNAIILHGISSTPNDFWFPYVKSELESRGYGVWVPQLPQPDDPDIEIYVPYILTHGVFTNETVIIGHSSGASIILAVLEKLEVKINKAILVSAFLTRGGARPAKAVKEREEAYDWVIIRSNAEQIITINSTNDPWGCDDTQGRKIFDHVGGLCIVNNDGHMGSAYFKQPYKEFPLVTKLVE